MSLLLLFAGAQAVVVVHPYAIKPRLMGEAKRQEPRLKGGGR